MIHNIYRLIRFSGVPFLFRELFQKNKVTILMFHDIEPETAENTLLYLSKKYNFISLNKYVNALKNKDVTCIPNKALIITFDDGHMRNYDLLSIFNKYEVPVTIFLSTEIVGTKRHFWFQSNAVNSIKDIKSLKKVPNQEKLEILQSRGFNQLHKYASRQALSWDEIYFMKEKGIDFQSHSMFHPCLPTCSFSEAKDEIYISKAALERRGFEVYAFCYPNGDYSNREISLCKEAGYECAITVDLGYNTVNTDPFKLKRLSVNDTKDLAELIVKSSGTWGFLLNTMNIGRTYFKSMK